MVDMNQVYDVLRKADARGDTEQVRKLSGYIREVHAEQEAPEVDQEAQYEAERQRMLQSNIDDMSTVEKGLVGAGQVVASGIEGVQDLYYGATGQDEKREELNRKADDDKAIYDELAERSTAVKVGNVLGEVGVGVATGVGVGGLYKGVKVAQAAGSVSKLKAVGQTTGILAAEGGVIEGVRNRGDALDRLVDASEGAVMSVGGQAVLSGAGKLIGSVGRGFTKKAGHEALDATRGSRDALIAAKKTSALEGGGYILDDVDAHATRSGVSRRDQLRRYNSPQGQALLDRHARTELDVTDKARSLIDEANTFEGTTGLRTDVDGRSENVAHALQSLRSEDISKVDAAYDSWRSAAGADKVLFDTTPIRGKMSSFVEDSKLSADREVHSQLTRILKHYGVLETKGKAALVAPKKPLTAGNYEQLIQDINGLYSPNNNVASKRLMSEVRELLEESKYQMLESAPGASKEAISLGEAARQSRKSFAAKWERGDIVDKLTSLKRGSEDYRAKPVDAMKYLMRPANRKELQRVKDVMALSKNPEHKQFWADAQAAPLFDALEKSLKGSRVAEGGTPQFNNRVFMQELSRYSDAQLDVLYGKGWTEKLNRAGKAWALREVRPDFQSNMNPSGTAEATHNTSAAAIRYFSASGNGGKLLAIVQGMSAWKNIKELTRIKLDYDKLLAGQLPGVSEDVLEQQIKEAIRKAFPNPQFTQYDSTFSAVSRQLLRSWENNQLDK
jgi:hypothetical protein